MPPASIPNVRVVVRLPENRPAVPLSDPPKIEWTLEKADILWKVIEKSRTSDSGGTDWKGLAAHLQVPLPYLLYRAHARFQEDLRGLQDVAPTVQPEQPVQITKSPRSIRARLNSLTTTSSYLQKRTTTGRTTTSSFGSQKRTTTSTSTLTLQRKPLTTSDNESSDSEDEEMLREEEAERRVEEQETLDRKLLELERMMTSDALGLVVPRKRQIGASTSASVSSASASTSSPQGSIPEIPTGSSSSLKSPPRGQRRESVNGSEASSFSDISDASLSGSALESALLSNIRGGGGSRFSAFARSRFGGGRSGMPL